MACNKPILAWQCGDGSITFNHHDKDIRRQLSLPCNKCTGCRLERARQWATRCVHEAQMHKDNCFITLTYDNEHIPDKGQLNHRDFQLFMKKLRKVSPKIKFYMCGEYGEHTKRPHYHAAIFGYDFGDKLRYSGQGEQTLYTSKTLDKIWGLGECKIGAVTFQSAAYIARYIMQRITGEQAKQHYQRLDMNTGEIYQLVPEYNQMSRGGRTGKGIGKAFLDKFTTDIYPDGQVVINGKLCRAPRYYDNLYKAQEPEAYENHTLYQRQLKGAQADQSQERKDAREVIQRAKLNLTKRDKQ